jgi:hypothetical protein
MRQLETANVVLGHADYCMLTELHLHASLKVWPHDSLLTYIRFTYSVSLLITGFLWLMVIPFLSICILWMCTVVDVLVIFPASVFKVKVRRVGVCIGFSPTDPWTQGGG